MICANYRKHIQCLISVKCMMSPDGDIEQGGKEIGTTLRGLS